MLQTCVLDLQIVGLMKVPSLTEDDGLSKKPLFTKYIEALPHALDSWKDTGLDMVMNLLGGIQKAVQHHTVLHQDMFRSAKVCWILSSFKYARLCV